MEHGQTYIPEKCAVIEEYTVYSLCVISFLRVNIAEAETAFVTSERAQQTSEVFRRIANKTDHERPGGP